MLERSEPYLKIVCLVLAVLLFYQVARLAAAKDPLKDVVVPTAPTLAEKPAAPAATATKTNPVPRPSPQKPEPKAQLPPAVQTSIDRIKDSEILAPAQRPLPMALLGIGGDDIFLRTPTGQTGMLKEGEELGGVKLLRIGTNRVLVEHEGQQKELTIFSGFGSETLIQK